MQYNVESRMLNKCLQQVKIEKERVKWTSEGQLAIEIEVAITIRAKLSVWGVGKLEMLVDSAQLSMAATFIHSYIPMNLVQRQ